MNFMATPLQSSDLVAMATSESPVGSSESNKQPHFWTAADVAGIASQRIAAPAPFTRADVVPVSADRFVWDAWPVQLSSGEPVSFGVDRQIWIALTAPRVDDPEQRHSEARLHFFLRNGDSWSDMGAVLPERLSPGSREWSGSAIFEPERSKLTLYFTAAGRTDEAVTTFEQRLYAIVATMKIDAAGPTCRGWRRLEEVVTPIGEYYAITRDAEPIDGMISGFRDPGFFQDPADGRRYLLFTASDPHAAAPYNGTIGIAEQRDGAWHRLPPLLSAKGVNNELERPHIVVRDGLYYLFWCTHQYRFASGGPGGPTGLYGMVAPRLAGPWRPLNGTGLVFANPAEAPAQAYSWLVLSDLTVTSFVNYWNDSDGLVRFGGTFAPFVKLRLDGDTAELLSA